jgi:uncharacterized BrkB/YihY/UPF0761 family membrane protein
MTPSLIAAASWGLLASVLGMLPSRNNHWRRAYGLIALAVPMLVWVYMENPIWISALVSLAVVSVLRWPVVYFLRWLGRSFSRGSR